MSITCNSCGATWPDGTTVCPACRSDLPSSQTEAPQYGQQYGQQTGAQQYGQLTPQNPHGQSYGDQRTTPGMATASLILGILSIICFGIIAGPLAIVFGTKAIRNFNPQIHKGRELAVAGRICGIIGLVGWVIYIVCIILLGASIGPISSLLDY